MEFCAVFEFIFWFSLFMIAYTYFGYPVCLWALAKLFPKKIMKGPEQPDVSVIISVFNEEQVIEKKLLSLLNQDYPEEKIEILVGSDGANDETDQIITKFHSPRIRFFRFVKNKGKPHVLNGLVREAKGSILVFTDARQEFSRHAIKDLVENFHDPKVGCVSGELHFREIHGEAVGEGMNAYWRYEKMLRKYESDIGSMLGATGAIYALRRHLYPGIPSHILVDDMYIPLAIVLKGFRAIFDKEAFAFDRTSFKGQEEVRRKVRTLAGNYQIFNELPGLFHPFKSPVVWQIISHKLLRLMVPYFLIGIFASNLFLMDKPLYVITAVIQFGFYGLAFFESMRILITQSLGVKKNTDKTSGFGYIPYTFCLLNYSAILGLIAFLTQKQKVAWKRE